MILNKVNVEFSFQSFYFNFYDNTKIKDGFFELDGLHYIFKNMHDEKYEKASTSDLHKAPSSLSSSIGVRMYENSTSLTQNLNASFITPKKLVT